MFCQYCQLLVAGWHLGKCASALTSGESGTSFMFPQPRTRLWSCNDGLRLVGSHSKHSGLQQRVLAFPAAVKAVCAKGGFAVAELTAAERNQMYRWNGLGASYPAMRAVCPHLRSMQSCFALKAAFASHRLQKSDFEKPGGIDSGDF